MVVRVPMTSQAGVERDRVHVTHVKLKNVVSQSELATSQLLQRPDRARAFHQACFGSDLTLSALLDTFAGHSNHVDAELGS